MAVLTILVVVQSGHHHTATGAAAGRCCKCVGEANTITGQRVEVGSPGNRITIAPESGALIVGNDDDDVLLLGMTRLTVRPWQQGQNDQLHQHREGSVANTKNQDGHPR